MTGQTDIRIGTLCGASNSGSYLKQMLAHGFESIQFTFWTRIDIDWNTFRAQALENLGDRAVCSSLCFFGNPLMHDEHVRGLEQCIDHAESFGTRLVCGFAGALDGQPVEQSLPVFRKVWGDLARRAEDRGVRLAFENCDMGGWHHSAKWNIAHAPSTWEAMFNEVPSDAIGLEWEPCHQMVSLIDPLPQLRKWVKKVYHVHGKDASIDWHTLREHGIRGGKPYVHHRTPGFGDTNWTDVISILRMGGYTGSIDIEGWHDPVYRGDLETTGQVYALNHLKHCRGGPYIPNPT